jgi:hypothetical protein
VRISRIEKTRAFCRADAMGIEPTDYKPGQVLIRPERIVHAPF